jgi:hypothetical protein
VLSAFFEVVYQDFYLVERSTAGCKKYTSFWVQNSDAVLAYT